MYYIMLAIFSLAVGSFLNVLIYRLPQMMIQEFEQECTTFLKKSLPKRKKPHLNLWWPRSFCPQCHHTLSAFSNIPIVSYLLQKGKCRHCHAKISLQYPLIEILTVFLSLYAAYHFGFHLKLIFALMFIWLMLPLLVIDYQFHLLPDSLTLSLLWIGLLANTQQYFTALPDAVYGAVLAYLLLWILVNVFYLITGRIGMGGGDLKLFAALGAWFGWLFLPLMLFFASVTGIIGGLIYLKWLKQPKTTPIPFGPFLCLTGLLTLFYGNIVLTWYLQ